MESVRNRREVLRLLGLGGLVTAGVGSMIGAARPLRAAFSGAELLGGSDAKQPHEQAEQVEHAEQSPMLAEAPAQQATESDTAATEKQDTVPTIPESERDVVAQLVGPLRPGDKLVDSSLQGCRGVRLGAASVRLQAEGGWEYQVDICKRDRSLAAVTPVASTERYDLFLSNGGSGNKRTDQKPGLVVLALAATIRANESRLPMLSVLTLRERLQKFPDGAFNTAA